MAQLNNHVRRRGSYAPLSVHYYLDDALARAGEEAELLYVRGLAFCAATLSDGFISDAQLARGPGVGMENVESRARKLVSVGAWLREEGGYRVRSWLGWNKSRDEILAAAEEDRKRKSRGGRRTPPPSPSGSRTESDTPSDRSPSGIHPESNGTPTGIRTASGSNSNSSSNSTTEDPPATRVPPTPSDRKPPRGTRLPDDFTVTDDMVAWARENTPHVDGRFETEQFRDYWQAKSGKDATKIDWVATWRNWMRKAEQQAPRQTRLAAVPNRTPTTTQRVAAIEALRHRPGNAS